MAERPSYGATSSDAAPPSKQTAPPVTKVEPKVFLASERTFFSWLRVSLLLGSFALALFNGGDKLGRSMGLVYAVISLASVAYSWAMFQRRSHRIRTTYAGNHDELYGPVIICVLLFAAVLANFILRIKHHDGKLKSPKSPWLAAYLNLFIDMQEPSSSPNLEF
ncbi:MAG: hypothetical protein CYPHOPRED_001461 [Cyphobasidiales sp. Tagirdzhanova-0007]|nr:MAG: hypothetical protein CYPHOPRED_001461 [Cyphobasidiales sp. Tagirdzhanova-0007]